MAAFEEIFEIDLTQACDNQEEHAIFLTTDARGDM
jgi:hypothetical protein